MKISPNSKNVIDTLEHLTHFDISENKDDGFIDLFLLPISSRNFDYENLSTNLLESVADYALSYRTKQLYEGKAMQLSKQARSKYKNYIDNEGELGELLLFCILEGHLEAPKIFTKLELKTSNKLYVNGSDGVHLKKISHQRYHLIFGESKTYKKLNSALKSAFSSIKDFKEETNLEGEKKSGIFFERGLISSNIESVIFDDDESEILELLMYPDNKYKSNVKLEDAFSIFIGYEIDISKEQMNYSSDEFSEVIKQKVIGQISNQKEKIYQLIKNNSLLGYTFYIFIMPFTEIETNRKKILESVLE